MTPEPVTLVVPFVGGGAYLRETLASAVQLEGTGWQLIVSDNTRDPGAGAEAQAIVASFGDPRLTWRAFGAHVVICASFNRAMDCAPTDLVALLHADDRIAPHYLATIRALAQRYPDAAAYYCGARIIDARGDAVFSFVDYVKRFAVPHGSGPTVLEGEAGVAALARADFIMAPTMCFRRSRLGGERWPEDLYQAADLEYFTRILFAGATIVGTEEPAYEYRRHAAQNTAQVNKTLFRFREESAVYDLIAQRAAAHGWSRAARIARAKIVTRLHLLYEAAKDAVHLRLDGAARKIGFAVTLR